MAITIQDDDKNKGVQPSQTSQGPQTQPVGSSPSKQQGSGFTNIQQIAQANTGNKLNQAVGGGVQQVGQQAQQAVGQAKNEFTQGVQSSNPYLTNTNQTQQTIQGVLQDPTKATDQQVTDFSKYRSGQYSGPQGLANYDALQQQAQQAQQLGQNLNTSGGRIALLQRFAANPTQSYTTGQSRLDSALLGMGPQQQLKQAQRATTGLTGQADTAQQAANAQAQEYQARAKGLADYTNQQIQGQENPTLDQLTQQAQTATAARDKVLQDFQNGTATIDELKSLGLGELAGQQSLNVNLSGYLNATQPGAASRLGVADAATAARLNALAKLGGQSNLQSEFDTSQGQQAGTFNQNQFTGADTALKAYNAAKTDYQNLQNQAQGSVNQTAQAMQSIINQAIPNAVDDGGARDRTGAINYLNSSLNPAMIQWYTNASEDQRKQFRESNLGDDTLKNMGIENPGQTRDAIVGALNQNIATQSGLNNLMAKYKGGSTYGG